jgi:hypothetical protein
MQQHQPGRQTGHFDSAQILGERLFSSDDLSFKSAGCSGKTPT